MKQAEFLKVVETAIRKQVIGCLLAGQARYVLIKKGKSLTWLTNLLCVNKLMVAFKM